jgi:hypothetical protein
MADPENQEQEQEVELTEQQESEIIEQAARETEDDLMAKAFERPRDPETGRYVKKEEEPQEAQPQEQEPEAQAQPEPAKEEKAEEDEQVPSWRLRELNEDRRRIQAENEQMRVQLARLQAMQEQAARAQAPPQAPDPLLDPVAYTRELEARYERRLQEAMLNQNLATSRKIYGAEKFDKAFDALLTEAQRGNGQPRDQVLRQADPGEAIMEWYQQRETLRTVGSDPEAYKAKLKQELLNDPEFIAQVQGHVRSQAMGGGQQPPRTVVRLPPSLAKVTGSSATADEDIRTQTDGSEAALFNYALRR